MLRTARLSILSLVAAATTQATMIVTYTNNTVHRHTHTAGGVTSTLNPDYIHGVADWPVLENPSAAFQNAMTKSKAAADFKGLTFDFTGELFGNIFIDVYYADIRGGSGAAQFAAHYTRSTDPKKADPPAADLHWIQVIDTTDPLGGEVIPYPDVYGSGYAKGKKLPFYYRPDETTLDPLPQVTGGNKKIRSSDYKVGKNEYKYDIAFTDFSALPPVGTWRAELFLASYDAKAGKVTVYDGINWGYDVTRAGGGIPEPQTAALVLTGLCLLLLRLRRRATV